MICLELVFLAAGSTRIQILHLMPLPGDRLSYKKVSYSSILHQIFSQQEISFRSIMEAVVSTIGKLFIFDQAVQAAILNQVFLVLPPDYQVVHCFSVAIVEIGKQTRCRDQKV